MRALVRTLVATLTLLLALPALVAVALNTAPGRLLAERIVLRASGGTLAPEGLAGRFPDRLRLAHLSLRDADGAWLAADGLALDLSLRALTHGEVVLTRLAAARLAVARAPVPSAAAAPAPPAGAAAPRLPMPVTITTIAIGRLELGAALVKADAAFAVDGTLALSARASGRGALRARRLDAPGRYAVTAEAGSDRIAATLSAEEPAGGLLAGLAGAPALGPLAATLRLAGPWHGAQLGLTATAGPLTAEASGTLDLLARDGDLTGSAHALAMAPRPDLGFEQADLSAHLRGPLTAPTASAHLVLAGLRAGPGGLARLAADLDLHPNALALRARLDGLRLPDPAGAVFAAAPLTIDGQMDLGVATHPFHLALAHPLLTATAEGTATSAPRGQLTLTVPDLAPLAASVGIDLAGHAAFDLAGTPSAMTLSGSVAATGGEMTLARIVGPDGRLAAAFGVQDGTLHLASARLDTRGLRLDAAGEIAPAALDLSGTVSLPDLAVLLPASSGALSLRAVAHAAPDGLTVTLDGTGEAGAGGLRRAPLRLALAATRTPAGAITMTLSKATWRSLQMTADLHRAPGATLPTGQAALRLDRLADIAALLGRSAEGTVEATVTLPVAAPARLSAVLRGAALPPAVRVERAELTATLEDPSGARRLDAEATARGIVVGGRSGSARLGVHGPLAALQARLEANAPDLPGGPATAEMQARLDLPARAVTLTRSALRWQGTQLVASGAVLPRLDLTVNLPTTPLSRLDTLAPGLHGAGTLAAEARLGGTLAAPSGTLRLTGSGLRLAGFPAPGLPAASLAARASLDPGRATIDARAEAGQGTALRLAGTVPLAPRGDLAVRTAGTTPLALRATGTADLALLDPWLAAQGRRLRGRLTADLGLGGSIAAPDLSGTLALTGGEAADLAQGVHLTQIAAHATATGGEIRLDRLAARAGTGTISAQGSLGVLRPGLPVALTLAARNATPLASDRLTATLDADLSLTGEASSQLAVAGAITLHRAEIRVPETLPASLAVLPVRIAGAPPPTPAPPPRVVALDLELTAPGAIFVHGRGIDAELGGRMHLGGTTAAPEPQGAFRLIRGEFTLAGSVLHFDSGRIAFNGAASLGAGGAGIDPALDFQASSAAGNVLAKLAVGGYASAPKITLSSAPPLPQDDILAHLLFGQSATTLSPFQMGSIALGLAEISGVGGSGINPLDRARRALGLDRLAIGSAGPAAGATAGTAAATQGATAPTLEAGRYVAPGVYVGAKQGVGVSGSNDTAAEVQVDLTKRLKLKADAGSGFGTNAVGLGYQLQY